MERKSYVELAGNGGYFSKFPYIEDSYDNFRKCMTERRKDHDDKQYNIS